MKSLKHIFENLSDGDTLSAVLKSKYNLVYNLGTGKYDCDGDVKIDEDLVEDGHLKVNFGKVDGEFDCIECHLSSLTGCPLWVGGDFICFDNQLTTLKGAPEYVGGGFFCDYNCLESIKGAPKEVNGHFACTGNPNLIYDEDHFYSCLPKIGRDLITDRGCNIKDTLSEKLSIDSIMEKLSVDSIMEKLSIDSIVLASKEFPIDRTIDDIIAFLEDAGFTYVLCNNGIDEEFDKYKCKCFYQSGNRLWFADTSKEKISKKNPIFLIKLISNGRLFSVYYVDQSDKIINIVENDKKEFLKELNKRFGWK